ncbi:helix-turn-helix domain-containing protein [Dinghuibacter silviterrae]|uniref:Helix-turn-helix protein n=1 Tax=Dinghuibacter silviterrae TaxID=1539049 RepID=A0A4R8DJ35_9BACT|nr:helix-turn-helix transcriptional regulator [Dinghuibacter silviterrae]TDW97595.1 helix-turn-helix protein [Dinghuibacter silviterrae]
MKRSELLHSKDYWLVQIQNNLYGVIEEYMKKKGINRTQLAEELNVTKGYISQVLNGDFDHKLSKLVDLAIATGNAPILNFVNLGEYIKDDARNREHIYYSNHKPVQYFNVHVHPSLIQNSTPKISWQRVAERTPGYRASLTETESLS